MRFFFFFWQPVKLTVTYKNHMKIINNHMNIINKMCFFFLKFWEYAIKLRRYETHTQNNLLKTMKTSKKHLQLGAIAMLTSVAINSQQANAAAIVYESFSQTPGALSGLAGETGLNNWAQLGGTATLVSESLSYGNLPHTGNQLDFSGNNADVFVTTTNALATAGLLDNGETVWFSFMYSRTNSNGGNEKGSFSFGSERIDSAYNGSNMINGGNAIGVYLAASGTAQAASWNGNGNFSGGGGSTATANDTSYMIVGQINWGATGADDETITLYMQDTSNLGVLSSSFSTKTMSAVDQTLFDTVSLGTHQSGGTITYDEIRFGATFDDVSGVIVIPEPSTTALIGLGGLALILRRRK
jgi:hypothetical protein